MRLGSTVICDALRDAGTTVVFGMAGSQNVDLFDALGASSVRTVPTTHEMAAIFAAIGFYRASGRVGVVTTIPGPGFTFASTGLAEARADSAAVLHIVPASNDGTGRPFQFQDIDQVAIARSLAKEVLVVDRVSELADTVTRAYRLSTEGEPGPVVVIVGRDLFRTPARSARAPVERSAPRTVHLEERFVQELAAAGRMAMIVGQGGQGLGASIVALARRLNAAVLTTSSGRGVVSEDDPRSLYFDFALGGGTSVNRFLEACDLVLALGCKFTHNGTGANVLEIDPDKLVHVDASRGSLAGRYGARTRIEADLGSFLDALLPRLTQKAVGWTDAELGAWRSTFRDEQASILAAAPIVLSDPPVTCGAFFEAFDAAVPHDAIVVTDSGLHQGLTRGFVRVRSERGLIVPADYQSMGFGVPVAFGARLASPNRNVVLIIGDGGMALSGLELLTAVQERLDLTVVVFNDGQLGSIRRTQIRAVGRARDVAVQPLDLAAFAKAIGAGYRQLDANLQASLDATLAAPGVKILDVPMADPVGSLRDRILGTARRFKRGRHLPLR